MAIVVSTLPAYVEEKRVPLIAKSVLGSKSASLFTLQTGVKKSAALNLINTTVTFGDGSSCGWNSTGTSSLTQRVLEVGNIKVNTTFCDKDLLAKWTGYEVSVAAGAKSLPFEQSFTEGIADRISEAIEKGIWVGNTSGSNSNPNTNKFDGLIKILTEPGAGTIMPTTVPLADADNAEKKIKVAYDNIPEEVLERGAVIFIGADEYKQYVQTLIAGNLYHYNPDAKFGEMTYLGDSRVTIMSTPGLIGSKILIAGNLENFFYGVDLEGDSEKFELWYSQDNREFRLAVEFNAGVQVAWPSEVVFVEAQTT